MLQEDAVDSIPSMILEKLKCCQVIFAENERTVRRFLKKLDPAFEIDRYEWHTIEKESDLHESFFKSALKEGKNIAIVSEAGCPGIADPGQTLVRIAHESDCPVHPLTGPISPMLALMASGMNGQHFEFVGYLPIEDMARARQIKELEAESSKRNSTKIFIETPYRNNKLLDAILQHCSGSTLLCIASCLTGASEKIISKPVNWWKKNKTDLHKQPAIFLIYAGKH
jgi:16S rRNA (cytidine1402-2'-O)-methyltransferase